MSMMNGERSLEKGYLFSTLFFSWIIAIACIVITVFAFYLNYVLFGIVFALMTVIVTFINIKHLKNWKQKGEQHRI